MKRLFGAIAIFLMGQVVFSGMAAAQSVEAKFSTPDAPTLSEPDRPAYLPFGVGESLEYSVSWGKVFKAGTAKVMTKELVDYQGHDVFKVSVVGKSSAAVAIFYKVREEMESLIDAKEGFTRRYWGKTKENDRLRERLYEFDQERNLVMYKNHKNKQATYQIPYGIHDEVSSVFHIRAAKLEVGTPVYVQVFAKPDVVTVKCNVIKREKINVPAGEFQTILVEPELTFDGVMKKGKMKIWFTDDERRMPVKVKSKMTIGSIIVQLEKYEVGNNPAYLAAER